MLLAGLAAFVLTSFRPMTVWGQEERYLEFASPWIAPLFVATAQAWGRTDLFLPLVLLHLLGIAVHFIYILAPEYQKLLRDRPPEPLKGALDAMASVPSPRILTIPMKLAFLAISHNQVPDAKYCLDWLTEVPGGFDYMLAEREVYQYPKTDLSYFSGKYGINTILVEKRHLAKAAGLAIHYSFDGCDLLYENETYCVYRRPPSEGR